MELSLGRRIPGVAPGVLHHEYEIFRGIFDIHGGGMDLLFLTMNAKSPSQK
jgi:hypothetical protein